MSARLVKLDNFVPVGGHSYVCRLPPEIGEGDTTEDPFRSPLEVFEDGRILGPAHSEHAAIGERGGGLYSHWHDFVYLSSSDHSDPRRNRRAYYAYAPATLGDPVLQRLNNLVLHGYSATGDRAYVVAESIFSTLYPEAIVGEFQKLCWLDQQFLRDYDRLAPGNRRSFERKYVVAEFVKSLGHVDGEMAECGVFNGATAFFMAQAAAASGRVRPLHLFDSFQGLSQPSPVDGDYWTAGDLTTAESIARGNLKEFPGASFYPGWIPSRFQEVADRRFAVVHIDVDLYQPTLDSMQFFYPRMASGGVMICDDYGSTACPGAKRAVDEFMQDRDERVIHLPTGQALILRR